MLEINLTRTYTLSEIAKLLGMSQSDIELLWDRWDKSRKTDAAGPALENQTSPNRHSTGAQIAAFCDQVGRAYVVVAE